MLTAAEIDQLRELADEVERRFPMPKTVRSEPAPADIEFGFADGKLALFQIRPFVESMRARRSTYLINMDSSDSDAAAAGGATIDLQQAPSP